MMTLQTLNRQRMPLGLQGDSAEIMRFIPLVVMAMLLLLMVVTPTDAWAQDTEAKNAITAVFTRITDLLTGGIARAIAIVAVIGAGMAAMAGRLTWDMAIKIIIGIVLIFGAATFVNYFSFGLTNAPPTTS